MHYATLVVLSTRPEDLDVAVSQAMEMGKDIHWDWYQIGGRWTGALSGYNPDEDPANLEGNGTRTKWPTQWARHPGDVVLVESLTREQVELFAHVVCVWSTDGSRGSDTNLGRKAINFRSWDFRLSNGSRRHTRME